MKEVVKKIKSIHQGASPEKKEYAILKKTEKRCSTRENILKSTSKNLDLYFEFVDIIIVVVGKDQRIVKINKKASEILGNPPAKIIGKNYFDIFIPEVFRYGMKSTFKRLISGEDYARKDFVCPLITKKDDYLILWHNTVLKDDNGDIAGVLYLGEDISKAKEDKGEERFKAFLENTQLGYIACDIRGTIIDVDQMFFNLTGYKREEVIGIQLKKFLPVQYRKNFDSLVAKLKNSENTVVSRLKIIDKNRNSIDVYCLVQTSRQQQILRIIFQDSTQRRMKEVFQQTHLKIISLLNSTTSTSTITSSIPDVLKKKLRLENVFIILKDGNTRDNKKKDSIETIVLSSLKCKKPLHVQYTGSGSIVMETKKNGRKVFCFCVPLRVHDELIGGLVCIDRKEVIFSQETTGFLEVVAKDISTGIHRCRNFEALKEENENYNAFTNATDDMTFIKYSKFRYIQLNKHYAKFFNKPVREIIGKTDFDLMKYSAARQNRQTDIQAIKENKLVINKEVIDERTYETRKFPVKFGTNEIGVGAFIRDITEAQQSAERVENLLWMYSMLCQITKTLTKAKDRQQIFENVCDIVTNVGRFVMAWIGIADYEKQIVIPVAYSKAKAGYVKNISVSLNPEKPEGKGPAGRAIRTGRCCICNNILKDPRMKPWKQNAIKYGFCSSASVPIKVDWGVLGVLNLYSDRPFFFSKEVKQLLVDVATYIGYCLERLIAEQQRTTAEQHLKENEAHMRILYDQSPLALAEIDYSALKKIISPVYKNHPGNIESYLENLKSNGTYKKLLRIRQINEQMYTLFETQDSGRIEENLSEIIFNPVIIKGLFENKTPVQFESAIKTSSGIEKNILLTTSSVSGFQGLSYIIVSIIDITERVKTERIIKSDIERFNGFFSSLSAGMALFDLDQRPVMLNNSLCDFLGYSMQELMQMRIKDMVHPEEIEIVENTYYKLKEGIINSYECERRYVRKDGFVVWGRVSGHLIFDHVANKRFVAIVLTDITEKINYIHRIERIQRVLRTLAFVNNVIIRVSDEEQMLLDICRIIKDDALFEESIFALKSDSILQIVCSSHKSGRFVSELQKVFTDINEKTPEIQAMIEGKPVIVNDIDISGYSDNWKSVNLTENLHSAICLPVFIGTSQIGSLSMYSKEKNRFRDKEEIDVLQAMSQNICYGISMARMRQEEKKSAEKLEQSFIRLQDTIEGIVSAIAKMVENRDPYTAGHQKRVALLSTAIAQEMGFSDIAIQGLRFAAILHDIGKVNVPVEILVKPTKLTDDEFSIIKLHSLIGYEILNQIPFPWPVSRIVLQHHERLNGSGYPDGLKEQDILLEAKIIAVADVVEAMAYDRPYRPALGIDNALKEIKNKSDILFDRNIVEICIKLFKEKGFSFY